MNITNVVLDRDREKVIFNNDKGERQEKAVSYSEDIFAWRCTVGGQYRDEINSHLLAESHHAQYNVTLAESTPEQVKQERYLKADGTDTIDKWAATRSIDAFRVIMFAQIEKYNDRLGKKDPILEEVTKMADYMNRWLEYEKIWDKE